MNAFFDQKNAERMGKVLLLLAVFAMLFLAMEFINEARDFSNGGIDPANAATIDVSGTGSVFAIPDIANESFTVEQKAATIADAQTAVTAKANAAIAFLKSSGVADADIQTTNYSANPDYSYPVPCGGGACPLDASQPKLLDYDVSETVSVKIRDTSAVGSIVAGLGTQDVTGLSGPNFTVDDPDTVNAEARAKAIDDAKAKAKVLAQQLGVQLVGIVRFSDNSGGMVPSPLYANANAMAVGAVAPAPNLPAGQNEYTSNVTITYEIR